MTAPKNDDPRAAGFLSLVITFTTHEITLGKFARLEAAIADSNGDRECAYLNLHAHPFQSPARRQFTVPPAGGGFVLDDLQGLGLWLRLGGDGDGSWEFSFNAVLAFVSGTVATLAVAHDRLTSERPRRYYPLSGALVLPSPRR